MWLFMNGDCTLPHFYSVIRFLGGSMGADENMGVRLRQLQHTVAQRCIGDVRQVDGSVPVVLCQDTNIWFSYYSYLFFYVFITYYLLILNYLASRTMCRGEYVENPAHFL